MRFWSSQNLPNKNTFGRGNFDEEGAYATPSLCSAQQCEHSRLKTALKKGLSAPFSSRSYVTFMYTAALMIFVKQL